MPLIVYWWGMATIYPLEPLLTVEDFLKIRFAADQKAELSNGRIRMMAGGKGSHARVQANILSWLRVALRGSGCRPFGSDMGIRTGAVSLRYPDISVFCGRNGSENDELTVFDDPKVVIEVLSPSTRDEDFGAKLPEYHALASVDAILFVEPETGVKRLIQRTGPAAWSDAELDSEADVTLTSLGLTIPNAEIFARD